MSSPTTPHKSVLGKGLASLLPGSAQLNTQSLNNINSTGSSSVEAPGSARHMGISVMQLDQIKTNEFQPRRDFDPATLEELAQSIRENGLIQPLIVRKNADNQYELIAGERRLRAAKLAGLKMVPVVIRKSTNKEALELAVIENIQREDLNCVDEALAYFQLMQEFQLSQEELSKKMGKDRATIANTLRVLKLSDFIINELKKGALTRGHAKALLAVEDAVAREALAKEILLKNLSVRQTEKRAQEIKSPATTKEDAPKRNEPEKLNAELIRYAQLVTRKFMTKTEFKGTPKAGTIQLHYSSTDELNRIMNLLVGE